MIALIAANAEIAEEVELARTLLAQGHLDTAQRVLVKVCQAQPEFAEAFRVLATVLSRRGDDRRGRPLVEYAEELEAQRTREIPANPENSQNPHDSRSHSSPNSRDASSDASLGSLIDDRSAARAGAEPARPPLSLPSPAMASPVAAPAFPVPSLPMVLPAPSQPTSPRVGALTLPATSAPVPTPVPPSRTGRRLIIVLGVLAALGGGGLFAYKRYPKGIDYALRALQALHVLHPAPARPNPREELDRALAGGSLDMLLRARDVARLALETGKADPDALARLGLVNAFLVDDYGIEARKDAEAALERAEKYLEPNKERASLVATARALLAHAAGERAEGKKLTDTAFTVAAPETPALALLVSARLRKQAGDSEGANRDLDKALTVAPESAPVVVDWASARLDGGDPVAARRALSALVERSPDHALALLGLANAERALGEPTWSKTTEKACRSEGKISQRVRALCAVEGSMQARLEGDRPGAARRTRAVAQTSEDPQILADAAMLLALLGDVDAAAEILDRAGKATDPSGIALQWADLAIRLGRGEPPVPGPYLEHPAGPERDVLALRAAYVRNGAAGLTEVLKQLPPGIQDIDWDVRAFSALGREGNLSKAELGSLERKADRGSPTVSYVLGVFASHDKDYKTAARRLERGLAWHGDTCQAAGLYLDAVKNLRRGTWVNKAALRNVRARNAKCPIPEP